MCKFENCKTIPIYNLEGEKAIYCSLHKQEGMIDVKHKKCKYEECKKRSRFNIEGKKAIYCSTHKLKGMVNVTYKPCKYEGCKILPLFNIEGSSKAIFCSSHKLEGMVNVVSKKCEHEDCNTQPFFNIEGSKSARFCSAHKLEGMINVVSKKCEHEECNTQPCFNIEGSKSARFCSAHKLEGMVDIYNKICEHKGCKILSSFNIYGEIKTKFCSIHKLEGMVDIKNKTCKTHLCSTIVQKKYDGYCLYCFMNMFPNKPVSRNYKTKERATVEHVITKYPELNWKADKAVKDGCSKRRPDLLLDLGYQIIIIEVDENQHTDYDCSCENKRIMELSQDLGHRPIIFIRFNPDSYLDKNTTITSCWSNNKKGICTITNNKTDEWNQRLNTLTSHIDYWIDPINKTDKTIETIQLFYDK